MLWTVNATAGRGICNSSAYILYHFDHSLRHPRSIDNVGNDFSNNDKGEMEDTELVLKLLPVVLTANSKTISFDLFSSTLFEFIVVS
jgi:hypothetical protein